MTGHRPTELYHVYPTRPPLACLILTATTSFRPSIVSTILLKTNLCFLANASVRLSPPRIIWEELLLWAKNDIWDILQPQFPADAKLHLKPTIHSWTKYFPLGPQVPHSGYSEFCTVCLQFLIWFSFSVITFWVDHPSLSRWLYLKVQ